MYGLSFCCVYGKETRLKKGNVNIDKVFDSGTEQTGMAIGIRNRIMFVFQSDNNDNVMR